jgi:hypothetical protein
MWLRLLLAVVVGAVAVAGAEAAERMVIHEWGTFTALQDENGRALGGINIDDEPLPEFVHNLRRDLLVRPGFPPYYASKGAPRRHPLVTMRLETPVIYFYPPRGQAGPVDVDVHVEFRGGWLTEFFPKAEANAPGIREGRFAFGPLTAQTVGTLDWRNVQVGTQAPGPRTDSHVWLAPRQTGAASVTAASGESEKYLFYRGVGNFNAPVKVTHEGRELAIRGNLAGTLSPGSGVSLGPFWLVHVRQDGSSAFRPLAAVDATRDAGRVLARTSDRFDLADYSADNLSKLSEAMHKALVADGLFADEATAMLETWRQAYFKSPGFRVFCLVPRAWTDHYLPLQVSIPSDITRVMIARIELISPEQQAGLKRMRSYEKFDAKWLDKAYRSADAEKLREGRSTFKDLGVDVPEHFQTFLDLGRFRNALVLTEQRRRPCPALDHFISLYGLEEFQWEEPAEKQVKPDVQKESTAAVR